MLTQIRQETARTIIEEQKLSNDVRELEEEAESLRKVTETLLEFSSVRDPQRKR